MSIITTSRSTERLSRKLQKAGLNLWVGQSSGDAWGKYLIFRVGGKCVAGCGWSIREATEIVDETIERGFTYGKDGE